MATRSTRSARIARQGGMNLLEILIGLAVFSYGILLVLPVFPTGVISGADFVRGTHATLLSRTAFAELEFQLRAPLFTGKVSKSAVDSVTPDSPPDWWKNDLWKNCFITFPGRLGGSSKLRSLWIESNDSDLTVPDLSIVSPASDDRFRINRFALPIVAETAPKRICVTDGVDSAAKNILKLPRTDPTNPTGPSRWEPATLDTAAGRYFVIMTSGRAMRKVYAVTSVDVDNEKLTCADADFLSDGVVLGDACFIAGCPDFDKWSPTPHFGLTSRPIIYTCSDHPEVQLDMAGNCPICGKELVAYKPKQTRQSPYLSQLPAYQSNFTYATIVSNVEDVKYTCSDHPEVRLDSPGKCPVSGCGKPLIREPVEDTEDTVRVDVLVFYRYNDSLAPDKNLRALAHHVRYLGRR